jgi:hypothetical protein
VISSSQIPLPDNTQLSQQTNIHVPVGFKPTISAGERPQTYALDCAATGTDYLQPNTRCKLYIILFNAELIPISHLLVLLGDLTFMVPCIVTTFQYTCISNKMQTLHSLFIFGNCSTCFGWYFHPSSWAHSTVSTASGICHTVTAICLYRGRVGTGLSVLWVAYATHSTRVYGTEVYCLWYKVKLKLLVLKWIVTVRS